MSALEELKSVSDFKGFAKLLGYEPKKLSYILYLLPEDKKYTEFRISKKTGGERLINAPVKSLKYIQKRMAHILQECYEETVELHKNASLASHGFRQDKGIISNASIHKNRKYVFNVDIKDYFPSINFGRIRGFFIKNKFFELNPAVATIIAKIVCYKGSLPQGSPASPVISNIMGHLIDVRMISLASRFGCVYTRYVDDITFSTNQSIFPKEIAVRDTSGLMRWAPGRLLQKEIRRIGYEFNPDKSRLQSSSQRQCVTGLVVNKKVNIKRDYYKKVRAMCDFLFKSDEFNLYGTDIKGDIRQLEGMLGYVYFVRANAHTYGRSGKRQEYKPRNKKKGKLICEVERKEADGICGISFLYAKLLFYRYFYLSDRPLLYCEGPTDIIHIKCALRALYIEYKDLIEQDGGHYEYKIGFLNHPKRFVELMAGSTGASALIRVVDNYHEYMSYFIGGRRLNPVIILVDNDKASGELRKRVMKKHGLKNGDPVPVFSHYVDNLYVFFVGEKDGDSIEDLYEEKWRNEKIENKTFSRNNDGYDKEKEYGKMEFALNIIRENESKVDFSAFKKLFDPINDLLKKE